VSSDECDPRLINIALIDIFLVIAVIAVHRLNSSEIPYACFYIN